MPALGAEGEELLHDVVAVAAPSSRAKAVVQLAVERVQSLVDGVGGRAGRVDLTFQPGHGLLGRSEVAVPTGLFARDDGRGGTDYDIGDEFSSFSHARGAVSLANRGRRDSAGSQFFIVHQDSPHIDGMFTVFARVVEGIEVVDAVTELAIDKYGRYGPRDRPYPKDARIASIRIEPAEPR